MTNIKAVDPALIKVKKPENTSSDKSESLSAFRPSAASIQLTRFTAENGIALTKHFEINDEKLQKTSAPQMSRGKAKTVTIKSVRDLEIVINKLSSNQCIATGVFDLPECEIATSSKITDAKLETGTRSRTQRFMKQPVSGLALLDYDPSEQMPEELHFESPEAFMETMQQLVPELVGVAWSSTGSCSHGIFAKDGSITPTKNGGIHTYILLQGVDLGDLKKLLEVRLWAKGYGYISLSRNGAMLPRTVVDLSVLSQERLIFEARPILGEGLQQEDRKWVHVDGKPLSDIPMPTEEEIATFEEAIVKAKSDPELLARQKEIKNEYCKNLIPTLVEKFGIDEDEAKIRADLFRKTTGHTGTQWVPDEQVPLAIDVNGEWLKPSEICERWEALDGASIPDPIEGREYGSSTAIIYGNNGSPVIHSWAHGVSRLYSLVQFEILDEEMEVVEYKPPSQQQPQKVQRTQIVNYQPPKEVSNAIQQFSLQMPAEKFTHSKEMQSGNKVLGTYENFKDLFNHYSIEHRYNAVTKYVETTIGGALLTSDNAEEKVLAHLHSLAALNGIPDKHLSKYIVAIACDDAYNPVADWIDSVPWDGIDRLEYFYTTITQREDFPEELKRIYIRRWLISGVAAIFDPEFRSRGVLTLQGEESEGKTTLFKSMVDQPELQKMVIKGDHHIDPTNKDSIITAVRNWIVELGEVEASLKNFSRLKPIITADSDTFRVPYGRVDSSYKRSTIFCATVNDEFFLVDDGANTRWWVIPTVSVDYEHNISMQQLWAQVKTLYLAGEQWWLSKDEEKQLIQHNRKHRAINSIRDRVLDHLNMDRKNDTTFTKRMGVAELLRKIGISNPTNRQSRDCGATLREMLGEPVARSSGTQKWDVPLIDEGI